MKSGSIRLRVAVVLRGVSSLGVGRPVTSTEKWWLQSTGVSSEMSVVRTEGSHVLTVPQLLLLMLVIQSEEVSDTLFGRAGDSGAEFSEQRSEQQAGRSHQGKSGRGTHARIA